MREGGGAVLVSKRKTKTLKLSGIDRRVLTAWEHLIEEGPEMGKKEREHHSLNSILSL